MFKLFIFALVLVKSIECSVIMETPLTVDEPTFLVRNVGPNHRKVDPNEAFKTRVPRSVPQAPAVAGNAPRKPTVLPTVENRNIFKVGVCPAGYVRSGGFCFLEEDYDEE